MESSEGLSRVVAGTIRIRIIGGCQTGNDFTERRLIFFHAGNNFSVSKWLIGHTGGEIGDHGNGAVTDFRFSGQLTFWNIGHSDDIGAPHAISFDFSGSFKTRAFCTDIGSVRMEKYIFCTGGLLYGLTEVFRSMGGTCHSEPPHTGLHQKTCQSGS